MPRLSPFYEQNTFRYGGRLRKGAIEANSSHGKMFGLVPAGSYVLETGCANGRFSSALVENNCRVVGVELDAGAALDASAFCESVIVGDLESPEVLQQIPSGFDIILFGDVLEHLIEPWKVLRALRPRLSSGGFVVASIPNVAHWDARVTLLLGNFEYQREGVLDSTHLRFFTKRTVLELFEQTGYTVFDLQRVTRLPWWVYSIRLVRRFAPSLVLPLIARLAPNLFTLQFIVRAAPAEQPEEVRFIT